MSKLEEISKINHDPHRDLFDREWAKLQDNILIKGLKSGQNIENILKQFLEFKDAFKPKGENLEVLKCCDGRVTDNLEIVNDEKLGLAGSGILFNPSELEEFIKQNKGKIKILTSHDECGAAALKYSTMLANGESMPAGVTNSDELGQYFAQETADILGVEYKHIKKEDFSSKIHNERLLVIDGTARFNANKVSDFPPRFISAALGLGAREEYVAKEAEVLANISLGDHGFGYRFNTENPFYVMIITEDKKQLKVVRKSLAGFVERARGCVQVLDVIV